MGIANSLILFYFGMAFIEFWKRAPHCNETAVCRKIDDAQQPYFLFNKYSVCNIVPQPHLSYPLSS